jgi:hypothetical protein
MSIDPALAISAAHLPSRRSNDVPARPTGRSPQANSPHPNLEIRANRELDRYTKETKSFELPQDVVQVQRESQHQIVIKYLDSAGKVIFQLPSSQMLALQRAIEQALDDQLRSHASNARVVGGSQGARNEY